MSEVWVVSEVVDYAGGEVLAVCRTLEGAAVHAVAHAREQCKAEDEPGYVQWQQFLRQEPLNTYVLMAGWQVVDKANTWTHHGTYLLQQYQVQD